MSHPGVQRDAKRLLVLFDSALVGLALDGSPVRFRAASPERQDARLGAWETSRLDVRRTGFRALRRLVFSAYYSSPATWGAIGYPGPPAIGYSPTGGAPPAANVTPPAGCAGGRGCSARRDHLG